MRAKFSVQANKCCRVDFPQTTDTVVTRRCWRCRSDSIVLSRMHTAYEIHSCTVWMGEWVSRFGRFVSKGKRACEAIRVARYFVVGVPRQMNVLPLEEVKRRALVCSLENGLKFDSNFVYILLHHEWHVPCEVSVLCKRFNLHFRVGGRTFCIAREFEWCASTDCELAQWNRFTRFWNWIQYGIGSQLFNPSCIQMFFFALWEELDIPFQTSSNAPSE